MHARRKTHAHTHTHTHSIFVIEFVRDPNTAERTWFPEAMIHQNPHTSNVPQVALIYICVLFGGFPSFFSLFFSFFLSFSHFSSALSPRLCTTQKTNIPSSTQTQLRFFPFNTTTAKPQTPQIWIRTPTRPTLPPKALFSIWPSGWMSPLENKSKQNCKEIQTRVAAQYVDPRRRSLCVSSKPSQLALCFLHPVVSSIC